jgi:hypothetical protein
MATDAQHPCCGGSPRGLHRHHLGAVSLLRGLQPAEIAVALRALSGEPDRDGKLPSPGGQLPGCDHVRLHLLTFDGLTIVGEEGQEGEASSHIAELWIGTGARRAGGRRRRSRW